MMKDSKSDSVCKKYYPKWFMILRIIKGYKLSGSLEDKLIYELLNYFQSPVVLLRYSFSFEFCCNLGVKTGTFCNVQDIL